MVSRNSGIMATEFYSLCLSLL